MTKTINLMTKTASRTAPSSTRRTTTPKKSTTRPATASKKPSTKNGKNSISDGNDDNNTKWAETSIYLEGLGGGNQRILVDASPGLFHDEDQKQHEEWFSNLCQYLVDTTPTKLILFRYVGNVTPEVLCEMLLGLEDRVFVSTKRKSDKMSFSDKRVYTQAFLDKFYQSWDSTTSEEEIVFWIDCSSLTNNNNNNNKIDAADVPVPVGGGGTVNSAPVGSSSSGLGAQFPQQQQHLTQPMLQPLMIQLQELTLSQVIMQQQIQQFAIMNADSWRNNNGGTGIRGAPIATTTSQHDPTRQAGTSLDDQSQEARTSPETTEVREVVEKWW